FRLSVDVTGELDDGPERAERLRAGAARLGVLPETLLLVDIETAGLTAAPLFLVGALALGPDRLTLTQYFARGYEEEAALLHAFVRTGHWSLLLPVFHHNALDLLTLAELLPHLLDA